MITMNREMQSSIKEGLRVFLMAGIPLLVVQLQEGSFMWKPILIAGVIAILRFVDKLLHETKVAEKGLTRF